MDTFRSVEEARKYYKDDHFWMAAGIRIETLEGGHCVCSMEIKDDLHRNAIGGVMGGALFTLADAAFSAASNNIHHPTVGLSGSISFLSAAKGKILTATADCVKDGGTTCVYEVRIKDDTGRDVALFTGTGFKLKRE